MKLRNRSLLAIPLAALVCATSAATASAQRGGGSGGQDGGQGERPPPRQERPPQGQAQGERARTQEAKQDQRQERRASAARSNVRPYQVRPGHLRQRMDAGGGAAEIQRGMLGEVNVNRDRLARIQRLQRIFEARRDERQLRRLEQLKDTEMSRYRRLMGQARGRLSEEEYRRFLDQAGDPRLAEQIEARQERGQERVEGGQ